MLRKLLDRTHVPNPTTAPVRPLPHLGPGCRLAFEALRKFGPLTAKGLSEVMPEGYQSVQSLRGRLSELGQHGLVTAKRVCDKTAPFGGVTVYRAIGGDQPVEVHPDSSHSAPGTTTASIASTTESQVQAFEAPPHRSLQHRPQGEQSPRVMKSLDLVYLDQEQQFIDDHVGSRDRYVRIERVNQAWRCRFLPVGLGDGNLWFVRHAQHWLNEESIVCPRGVSLDFGGDPNADCPVCALADALNAEDNEKISKLGFKLRANITYLTYCLVFEIDPGKGKLENLPDFEIMKPWKFYHDLNGFQELLDYFRRGATQARPMSVLDLEKGNDFWATRTTKGVRLDRNDPAPIFPLDDQFDAKINQIFGLIQQPKIKLPTMKELETFARKAEAAAHE